jgi:uncharacterized membrane protein (UPF0127 family)
MSPTRDEQSIAPTDLDRKIAELGRTIALNANSADAYRARGLLYGRKRDFDRAMIDFDTALTLNPRDARTFGFRGLIWQMQGENGRAIAEFDRAIELDPANASIYQAHREKSLGDAAAAHPSSTIAASAHANSRFNLLLNPFVLLGLAPSATVQSIKQAYEDALEDGIASADDLQRAQQLLLTPRLRVDAEIGGLLDVAPDLAKQVIAQLKRGATKKELKDHLISLHALPRSNVLTHLGSASPMGAADLIQLLEAQETISVGSVYDIINEVRAEAGSGKIDRAAVTDALSRLEERQTKAVIDTLVSDPAFAATFTSFVKHVLANEDRSLLAKLDTHVRAYNQAASPELSRRREMVIAACDAVRKDPKNRKAVDQIASALRSWNEIEQPLQLFEAHMNREEPQARDLYINVRDLCIWLANEKSEYETAKDITQACADVFSNLPRSLGQMQEESEQLTKLRNEQTAVTLLTPLSAACEAAQQNHRTLEKEVLRNGFSSKSKGLTKTLYDEFTKAVVLTKTTDIADLPWRLVRDIAISLNNDSRSPKAAVAVIDGLINFYSTHRPSKATMEALENDKRIAQKTIAFAEFEQSMMQGRLASAASLVEHMLTLETDSNEIAALHTIRDSIAAKRRKNKIKTWGWVAVTAVIVIIVAANQDNHPSAPTGTTEPSSRQPSFPPVPNASPVTTPTVDRPQVGEDLAFTQANIRYCAFQRVRLETAQSSASSDSAQLAIGAFIDDWNSRCSKYRYRASDKSVVDAEVATRQSALEAEGRAIANRWLTAPVFSRSALTIDTTGGQRRLTVELAVTPQQWMWGTSFRSSMPLDSGMLYIYPTPKTLSNSMMTAYFSLDVLFIDESWKITEIIQRRAPKSGDVIWSKTPGSAMLELNAGTAERLGINVGNVVQKVDANNTPSSTH